MLPRIRSRRLIFPPSPLAGEGLGGEGVFVDGRFSNVRQEAIGHPLPFFIDVAIPESKNFEALRFQPSVTPRVVGFVLRLVVGS